MESVETALRGHKARHGELDESRDAESAQIKRWSRESRFAELTTTVSHQFADKRAETLETKSAFYIAQLEDRVLEIDHSLEESDQHHDRVVNIVAAAVDDGLKLLKRVSRMSKLPDKLPQAGQHFIRITTNESDNPADRRAKIADLIGEVIHTGDIGNGLSLIQRGVRRVAVTTKVRVLHPDLRSSQRLSMPELLSKSNGERLTCAILLYCALVRLRQQGGAKKGSNVLLLDNPIGTASRIAFLNLQREVAAAMNVQLIYATGVKDLNAVGALENIIRLRNTRVDRRTNRRFVELRGTEDSIRQIEATRVAFDSPPGSTVENDEDEVLNEDNGNVLRD